MLREIFGGALEAAVTEEVAHAVEVLEKEFPGEERHGQAALDGEAGDILWKRRRRRRDCRGRTRTPIFLPFHSVGFLNMTGAERPRS